MKWSTSLSLSPSLPLLSCCGDAFSLCREPMSAYDAQFFHLPHDVYIYYHLIWIPPPSSLSKQPRLLVPRPLPLPLPPPGLPTYPRGFIPLPTSAWFHCFRCSSASRAPLFLHRLATPLKEIRDPGMGSSTGSELESPLVAELARALELVRQLESHLSNPAPIDLCKSVAPEILSSIQRSILMVKSSDPDGEQQAAGDSPRSESSSPAFKDHDRKELIKKRWASLVLGEISLVPPSPADMAFLLFWIPLSGRRCTNGRIKWGSPQAPEESKGLRMTATAGESTGRRTSWEPNIQGQH